MRMMGWRTLLAATAAFMLLSGCASNPEQKLPSVTGETKVSVEWRSRLGDGPGALHARMTVAVSSDDVIYAADTTGTLSALTLEKGKRLWETDFEQTILGGVGLDDDQLYVSLKEGSLVALSTETGEELWRAMLPSESVAPAIADYTRVYVQTVDGRVTALNRNDGSQLWTYEAGLPVLSVRGTGSPLMMDEFIVAGFATGKVVALDKTLGVPRWDVRLGVPDGRSELERLVDVDGTPSYEGQLIYAAAYHGKLAALTPNGETVWEEDGSSYTSPELSLGSVYMALDDDVIQAYDMLNGAEAWQQDALKGRVLGQITATGSSLAVADSSGYVHILSQLDGRLTGRIYLRPRPLHINYPQQTEATNGRLARGRDFGIRSTLIDTDAGLLVYTNFGELLLLTVE